MVGRDVVTLAALLVQPEPPPALLPEVVLLPHRDDPSMPGTLILDSNRECPDTPIWADLAVRGVTMPIGPMNPGLAKGAAGV